MAVKTFRLVGYMPSRLRRDIDPLVMGVSRPSNRGIHPGDKFEAEEEAMEPWVRRGSVVSDGEPPPRPRAARKKRAETPPPPPPASDPAPAPVEASDGSEDS